MTDTSWGGCTMAEALEALDKVSVVLRRMEHNTRLAFGLPDPNPFPRLHLFRRTKETQ